MAQLVAAYLSQIGVKLVIEPLEYGAFLSRMTTGTHGPAYWHNSGLSNPTSALRKLYDIDSLWNTPRLNDPKVEAAFDAALLEPDEAKRIPMIKKVTVLALEQASFLYLPAPEVFTAWWPWVKNYDGELAVGAQRNAPIWARAWIDQAMKKKMGY